MRFFVFLKLFAGSSVLVFTLVFLLFVLLQFHVMS